MTDVVNSIFGRSTDTTDAYGTTEVVVVPDAEAVDTEETHDHETVAAEDAADAESVSEEDIAEPAPADEAGTVIAEAEPAPAGTRPAAGIRGSTTVVDDVVAKVVDRVVGKVEGVHEYGGEAASVGVEAGVATIMVSLVLEFGHAVKAVAEQIRIDVVDAVEGLLGLDVEAVDVHITDIHFPDHD
jgi:uncharacterized alkaline shock family protein YloU